MGFQLSFAVWLAGEPEEDALEWCKIRHGDLYYRSETQPLTRLRKLIHPRGSVPRVSELVQTRLSSLLGVSAGFSRRPGTLQRFVIARAARRLRNTNHIRRTRGTPSGPLRPEPRLELPCELL